MERARPIGAMPMRHKPSMTVDALCVGADASMEHAMVTIDRGGEGIALVVDADRRLLGTLTDGDIRRALLRHEGMSSLVSALLDAKASTKHPSPVTASAGVGDDELLSLMYRHEVRHIPLLDGDGRVVDLGLMRQLATEQALAVTGVVMAGGAGQRLRPLTLDTPKPMLPVGDKPIMERIVDQMRQAGVGRVCVTTHYKPEKITEHFGDGSRFGIAISYVNEEQPLGTAGALGLLEKADAPLLVINGDILTRIDFRAIVDYHREASADITVAVRRHQTVLPYGVVDCLGSQVVGIVEKPTHEVLINAGIYVIESHVLSMIPVGRRYDMTDLIRAGLEVGRRIEAFPVREMWLDVGRPEDYQTAQSQSGAPSK